MKYPTRYLVILYGTVIFTSDSWLSAHEYSGLVPKSTVEKTNKKFNNLSR